MGIAWTITYNIRSDNGGPPASASSTEYGTQEESVDLVIPAGTVDQPVAVAFAKATLQGFFMVADQNMTVKTNSASSPTNVFNLVAGNMWLWGRSSNYYPNPFTADVTGLFISAASAGRIRLRALIP